MDKKESITDINKSIRSILCLLIAIFFCGCTSSGVKKDNCNCFIPAELLFRPAFCHVKTDAQGKNTGIDIYLQVTDQFGDSMKLPGVFRIELFERQGLNQDKTGERITIDNNNFIEFDLRNPIINHQHWDRITSCYRLIIDRQNLPDELIAQITWFYDQNYRLTNIITIKNN